MCAIFIPSIHKTAINATFPNGHQYTFSAIIMKQWVYQMPIPCSITSANFLSSPLPFPSFQVCFSGSPYYILRKQVNEER